MPISVRFDSSSLATSTNKVFNVTASGLMDAVFTGGTGTDTLNLIEGGTFDLTMASLSSIEIIRGTTKQDTIYIDAKILSSLKTISGGGGGDILKLYGGAPLNFSGKAVGNFSRIEVASEEFAGIFTDKTTALLVRAQESQNDSLTLTGGTFTEAERTQLHRQGVDTIVDSSGTYTNYAPKIYDWDGDTSYTTGGLAFLDKNGDATLGAVDDNFKSLEITCDTSLTPDEQLTIVPGGGLTLPDGVQNGAQVVFEGVQIGEIAITLDGLIVNFNSSANQKAVETLIHSLAYRNSGSNPANITSSSLTIALTDEGGRKALSSVIVTGGTPGVGFLTSDEPVLSGTAGEDAFAADQKGLGSHGAIDGGDGTDTLYLFRSFFSGDTYDLTALTGLTGVEVVKGTVGDDWITISGSQLTDVLTIDGGENVYEGTVNWLSIVGDDIDLRGKSIDNFSGIRLLTDNAVVTLDDKSIANLITGPLTTNDRIELVGDTFTAAEKGTLFRRGIETISDASGTYINSAPELTDFDGDHSSGIAGDAIFLDEDRDAILSEDDQALSVLEVSVKGGAATERLGLASTGKVQVIEMVGGIHRVYVNGINIGFIASPPAGGPELTIQLNEKATPQLVQEVIRALTYTDTTGTITTPREITVKVTDYTNHSTDVSVTVEQELNQKPADMALDGSLVAELAAKGTLVGVLSTTDENEDDTFTYTLLNDAGGRFTLKGNVLVVKQGTKLDYEQAGSHEITVRVTDKLGLTFDKTFTIEVVNVEGEIAVGTSGRDIFVGGVGDDRFYGKLGNDRLTGDVGRDIFVFDTKLGPANIDTIRDFTVKDDTIWLSRSIFTKAGPVGTLSKNAFWIGAAAHDASDRILYNDKTGALLYDRDGTGATRPVKFAQVSAGLKMTAADFVLTYVF